MSRNGLAVILTAVVSTVLIPLSVAYATPIAPAIKTSSVATLAANQAVANPTSTISAHDKQNDKTQQKASAESSVVNWFLFTPIFSALFALGSAVAAFKTVFLNRHIQQWIINYNLLTHTHDMLHSNPELLTLYDIDTNTLASEGITSSELIFVYSHMDAAGAFYRVKGNKSVHLTDFRKNFLKNAKVRLIWKKYLHGKMFSPSPFRTAVDQFIAEYERMAETNSPQ